MVSLSLTDGLLVEKFKSKIKKGEKVMFQISKELRERLQLFIANQKPVLATATANSAIYCPNTCANNCYGSCRGTCGQTCNNSNR